MKVRYFITMVIALIVAMTVNAAPISQSKALENAKAFMSARGLSFESATAKASAKAKSRNGQQTAAPAYYIFGNGSKFVIAAGDDTMPAVLGYSDSNTFDPNDVPEGLADLLEAYAAAANGDLKFEKPTSLQGCAAITPLVKARWNQSAPWNNACPVLSSGSRAATGCVATAMAQVMSYYRWPATVSENIPAYTTSTLKIEMPELDASLFPGWSNIKDYYHYDDTSGPAADDVAMLMLFVGQSLEMNYNSSSGASTRNLPEVLTRYFGYSPTTRYLYRTHYTAEQWDSIQYNELASGRPTVLCGTKYGSSGHAFVCDGYDGNGMFHINWGWYGKSDGYFLLNSLNPSDQGIGSATGADGYLLSRGMVIGIQPNKGDSPEIPPLCLTYSGKKIENGKYTRSSSSNKFTNILINGRFSNTTTETKSFDFGFGIFDKNSGELLSTIYSAWFKDLETSSGATKDWMCNVPSTIPDGQYRVFPISRVRETPEWLKCHGAETNYYDIIISGDTLTLTSMGNVGYKDYQINSVTFNGTKQAGRAIEVAANVTNKGNCILSEIYLLVNGNSETISMCEVKPGETGDITMHFTPKDPGTYDISLSTDEDGKEILYTTSLTIGDALPGNISFSSIQVKDATSDKKINGNTFAITSTAKNNGQTPYNDVVVARLYRRVSSSSGTLSRTLPQEVSLAPGKSQKVEFVFKDLPTGEDFFATLAYYNMGTLVRYNSTSFHTILGNPAKFGDVNEDGIVDIADINVLINIILGSDKRVTPLADCNGDGIVDIADLNMVINEILK